MEVARYLIAVVAVFNSGGLVADAIVPVTARQHLFNPHWPPHAKFHNAQTMLMGLVSGTLSLAILFRHAIAHFPRLLDRGGDCGKLLRNDGARAVVSRDRLDGPRIRRGHASPPQLGPATAYQLRGLRPRNHRNPIRSFCLAERCPLPAH